MHNPRWLDAQHTRLLDQALVYLEQRAAPASFLRRLDATQPIPEVPGDELLPFVRLIIQEPPRHGKSEHVSRYFTAWYLGRHPDHHVILTSYGSTYAATWGRKSREVLERHGEEAFGVKVSRRTSAAADWEIEGHTGGMITAGVGGPITGRGANCLVVDDPVKDAQEAASAVVQQTTYDWWQAVAYTRLEADLDGTPPIALVIQTRWNEADLTGRILVGEEDTADDEVWYSLRLPAIAEDNDPLGRLPGEELWPEVRPLAFLERIKARLSSYWWSALYQQRPTPEAGELFLRHRWQYWERLPEGYGPGYILVDTAGWQNQNEKQDYAAWAAVRKYAKDLYWLEADHGHWTFPELVQRLKDAAARTKLPVCVEDTPWARPLIQVLQHELSGVVPFKIGGVQKEVRAQAASPYQMAGNFYLPKGAKWTGDFVEEHAAFPNGAHDDWVDTTSMAVLKLIGGLSIPTSARRPMPRRSSDQGWRQMN